MSRQIHLQSGKLHPFPTVRASSPAFRIWLARPPTVPLVHAQKVTLALSLPAKNTTHHRKGLLLARETSESERARETADLPPSGQMPPVYRLEDDREATRACQRHTRPPSVPCPTAPHSPSPTWPHERVEELVQEDVDQHHSDKLQHLRVEHRSHRAQRPLYLPRLILQGPCEVSSQLPLRATRLPLHAHALAPHFLCRPLPMHASRIGPVRTS